MLKYAYLIFFITIGFVLQGQCYYKNTTFIAGEKVTYQAYYNWHFIWMNAGEVVFKVENCTHNKKAAYKLSSLGYTQKGYDKLYCVRDTFTAIVDTQYIEPYATTRKAHEGSYIASEVYRFDKANKRIYSNIKIEDEPARNTIIQWKECTVDVLTMVYKARNIDYNKYKVNDKIPIRMVVDGEIHDLYIRYLGKEIIETKDEKKYRCLKFSPLLMKGTIFESGEDMTVWVTDDKNRIPVIVEAKILIGSVKAILSGTQGLRHPIEAEIK